MQQWPSLLVFPSRRSLGSDRCKNRTKRFNFLSYFKIALAKIKTQKIKNFPLIEHL